MNASRSRMSRHADARRPLAAGDDGAFSNFQDQEA
jgi:hypothetical protein